MVHNAETFFVCVCVTIQVNEGHFIMQARRLNSHFHIVVTTVLTSDCEI
jgi:hypothetical protein